MSCPCRGESLNKGPSRWNWSIPYKDPDAGGVFTVDDPIGEILGEPAGADLVIGALEQLGAPGFLKGVIFSERKTPLRSALQMMPDPDEAEKVMNEILKQL